MRRHRFIRIVAWGAAALLAVAIGVIIFATNYFGVPPQRIDHMAGSAQKTRRCHIKRTKPLPPGGNGTAWSPSNPNVFIYSKPDSHHVDQIYRHNQATGRDQCLTCIAMPGGPPANVNKGFASYDPGGRYMIMQVVMPSRRGRKGTDPGQGYFQNIWAWNLRTNRWYNLTHYSTHGDHGVLIPRLSRDGKHLAWAEIYQGAPTLSALLYYSGFSLSGPVWGSWRLSVANIVDDATGIHLSHIQHFSPGHAYFYETQDWAPDNRTLLFAASIGQDSPWKLSLWTLDTVTGRVHAITHFDSGVYSEHAAYTNDGKQIIFMSTRCCHVDFSNPITIAKTFRTELYAANADGSHAVQLTSYNAASSKRRVISDKVFFNPFDGGKAILEQQILPKYGVLGTQVSAPRLLLTLSGACSA